MSDTKWKPYSGKIAIPALDGVVYEAESPIHFETGEEVPIVVVDGIDDAYLVPADPGAKITVIKVGDDEQT